MPCMVGAQAWKEDVVEATIVARFLASQRSPCLGFRVCLQVPSARALRRQQGKNLPEAPDTPM